MFYLINNDSELSISQQIATCDTFVNVASAMRSANVKKKMTGKNWEVLEIRSVFTTQTLDEAHMAALDVPNMARD